jgi:hypothetical protein
MLRRFFMLFFHRVLYMEIEFRANSLEEVFSETKVHMAKRDKGPSIRGLPRRGIFSETHIQPVASLCVRTGAIAELPLTLILGNRGGTEE